MSFTAPISWTGRKARDSLDYRVRGKLSLAAGFMRTIPFEEKGSFRLKDLKGGAKP